MVGGGGGEWSTVSYDKIVSTQQISLGFPSITQMKLSLLTWKKTADDFKVFSKPEAHAFLDLI